jgi:hypothetical protein
LKLLVLLLFLGNSLAFALAMATQLSGLFNVLGWSNVFLYLFFAAGYGYYCLKSILDKDTS